MIVHKIHEGCEDETTEPMTHDQIIEWARVMRDGAVQNFMSDGSLMPVFMFVGKRGGISIVVAPDGMQSEASKDALADFVRTFAQSCEAVAILFMSEAWVSHVARDQEGPYRPPSEDPRRREIIMASLDTYFGARLWSAEIKRGGDGPVVEDWAEAPYENVTGRFVQFLSKPDEGAPQ